MSITETPWHPFVVLTASDSPLGARSLNSVLGASGYSVIGARSGQDLLDRAGEVQPDAVILDVHTPDMPGVKVCRLLSGDPDFDPATPIIMTTSHPNSRADRLDAYAAGAWDICAHPLDGVVLLLKLQTFLRAKYASTRVRDNSLIDDTTGLYNRRGMRKRAGELVAHATRRSEPLACVAFTVSSTDADGAQSPAPLQRVAEACRRTTRASDIVGRFGDREFVVFAPTTDRDGATALVQRLQDHLDELVTDDGRSASPLKIEAGYWATGNSADLSVAPDDLAMSAINALHDRVQMKYPAASDERADQVDDR